MATATKVNYTPAQEIRMKELYTAIGTGITDADYAARDAVVEQLKTEFGKSVRSIRGKMSREKYYIKRAAKSTVTNGEPAKKEELAAMVVAALGTVTIAGKEHRLNADSMAKANKTDIALLLHVFNSMIVEEVDDEIEDENDSQEDENSES